MTNEVIIFNNAPISFDYFDKENSHSIVRMVDDEFAILMKINKDELENIVNVSEHDLRKEINPSPELNIVRIRFWEEYRLSAAANKPMNMANVYSGICTKWYFFKRMITSVGRLGWILKPPKEYTENISEIIDSGISAMREIMQLDIYQDAGFTEEENEKGEKIRVPKKKLDMSIVNAKMRAFSTLDTRIKGAPKQTIEKKSVGINFHKHSKEFPPSKIPIELTEEEKINQDFLDAQQDLIKIKYDPRITQENK